MKVYLLAAAAQAALVCELSLTQRQLMSVSLENGDEQVGFVSLMMQCADLWKDHNGVTVTSPIPLYNKRCTEWDMVYNPDKDACGRCPNSKDQFAATPEASEVGVDEMTEFHGCWSENGKCSCNIMQQIEMKDEMMGYTWIDYRHKMVRVTPVDIDTCTGDNKGDCFRYEPAARSIDFFDRSRIFPALDCGDAIPMKESTIPSVPNVIIPPPVKKDPIHTLIRMMNNFGFETQVDIVLDSDFVENRAIALFLSSFESKGSVQKMGPTLKEMQDHCKIKLNIFLDADGKALNDNKWIPAKDIPVIPPPCVAQSMELLYDGYRSDLEGIDRVREMDVECDQNACECDLDPWTQGCMDETGNSNCMQGAGGDMYGGDMMDGTMPDECPPEDPMCGMQMD
jgi:hypothetical protein